jgi:hypothetical protein
VAVLSPANAQRAGIQALLDRMQAFREQPVTLSTLAVALHHGTYIGAGAVALGVYKCRQCGDTTDSYCHIYAFRIVRPAAEWASAASADRAARLSTRDQ